MKKDEELCKIKDEVINCKKCSLYKTRTFPVIGEGNHNAKIMFIGEGPGLSEDRTGRPFCGAAGKVLDELLNKIEIQREDVYISNLVKCRPPANRDPEKEEIKACSSYLNKQIQIIDPKVICPLGRYSMHFLMEKFGLKNQIQPISKIHGKVFKVKNLFKEIIIIPLYHPAVATYNPNMKEILKKDFKILKDKFLGKI